MKLYLTDFNPNGTNDLLIVNDEGLAIDCIEEATFGFQVDYMEDHVVMDESGWILNASNLTDNELDRTIGCGVVTWAQVLDKLACNPFDPKGEHKLRRIKAVLRSHLLVKSA